MIGALAMTVLLFVSMDCPVSNRYAPEIKRLHDEFAPRGVRFRLVYPNPLDDEAAIGRHLRDFAYPPIAQRDRDHALVRWRAPPSHRKLPFSMRGSASSIAAASTTASSSSAANARPPPGTISGMRSQPSLRAGR